MIFVLKIIRFFVGLLIKIVAFPIKLIWRLVGSKSGDEFETPLGDETTLESDETTGAAATEATKSESLEVDSNTAARNIAWFRKGLIGLGAVQIVLGMLVFVGIGTMPVGGQFIGVVLGGILVTAVPPIVIGIGISKRPTVGWYAGMVLTVIYIAGSVFALPSSLLGVIVYAAIGYLGYTGRPALHRVYGDEVVPSENEESEQPSANTDSETSAEREGDTAKLRAANADSSARPTVDGSVGSATSAPDTGRTTSSERSEPAKRDGTDAPGKSSEVIEKAPKGQTEAEKSTADADGSGQSQQEDSKIDTEESDTFDPLNEYQSGLTSDDPTTRQETIRALADAATAEDIPDQAVIDALSKRLSDDENTEVRVTACEALGRLRTDNGRAQSVLQDHRLDADTKVSRAASRALRKAE